MVELVRMGLMCSVARSAQADMQSVESSRMSRARQRDQCTTALCWWPGTGDRAEGSLHSSDRSQPCSQDLRGHSL